MGASFGEDPKDEGRNFLVDFGLAVFAYNVDTAFLSCEVSKCLKRKENRHVARLTRKRRVNRHVQFAIILLVTRVPSQTVETRFRQLVTSSSLKVQT